MENFQKSEIQYIIGSHNVEPLKKSGYMLFVQICNWIEIKYVINLIT